MNKADGREIRFAVVMYGGVSLAIYINGVAQELLKMCRATAETGKTGSPETTERVYRKISYLLSDEKLLNKFVEAFNIKDTSSREKEIAGLDAELEKIKPGDALKTKFVVDVLTGTSAGGINAIFLAKALANNQDIEQLKDLWLSEGDIGVLINDEKSVADINLSAPDKAKSLLNSQRMYLKLLEAFDEMDRDPDSSETSPFVKELDLFVPTTDFRGTTVPLRLFDKIVEEKRYRQVFHFRYDPSETDEKGFKNDFKKRNNPMLALAARATSSFPFAFEPMRYEQARSVIEEAFADWRDRTRNLKADVKEFFPKIIQKNGEPVNWEKRDLVDGGVLDNKPFGYAIDVLSKRRSDFQVKRKLLYIEPSPESFSSGKSKEKKAPDVLENAVASLSTLPSYETIREDLERLLERNRLIERVNLIISSAEQDVFQQLIASGTRNFESQENRKSGSSFWKEKGLEDIVEIKGRAVLPYYRLRIAALTDDIARLVSKLNGVDEKSEYFEAIRKLVKIWRMKNFGDYKNNGKQKTVLAFLWNFDLIYRFRRLRFVQAKAGRLYFYENDFLEEMCERFVKFVKIRTESGNKSDLKQVSAFVEESIKNNLEEWEKFEEKINWELCREKIKETDYRLKYVESNKDGVVEAKPSEILFLLHFQKKEDFPENEDYKTQVCRAVDYFQDKLGSIFQNLQKESKLFGTQKNLLEKIKKIKLERDDLDKLLSLAEKNFIKEDADDPDVKPIWDKFSPQITDAGNELENTFNKIFADARQGVKKLFDSVRVPGELKGKVNPIIYKAVRGYLKHYYNNFDEYDQISFPIFYQTQVGEAVKVDVMRISPKDATGLIDEEKNGKPKLAGESLFHFGAFLDRTWRWNDIMWGRLDGAERLITALLPDEKYAEIRKFLTRQAHIEILKAEFLSSNKETLQGVLAESLTKVSAGLKMREVVGEITGKIGDAAVKTELAGILKTCLTEKNVYDFVQKSYEIEKQLEPKSLLRVISRSTKVTGDIFEAVADDKASAGSRMRWIARLGQIFWGLVEVAAPGSFWNKLVIQWLMLLYLFEIVLIVGSTIFVKPEVQQFGIMALILTLITHLTAITLHDYMRGGKILYLLRFVAVGLMAILAISGALFIYGLFFDAEFWQKISGWQADLNKYEHWQRLFPVSCIILLFVATLVWRETQKLNVRFYGAVTLIYVLLVVLTGGWMTQLASAGQGINGLGPVLSLEFPKSIADVEHITRSFRADVVENLKWALTIDSFLFVPLYAGFLLFFARLLRLRRSQWIIGKPQGVKNREGENDSDVENWKNKTKEKLFNLSFLNLTISAVSVFILMAGLADLIENYFSYAALANASLPQWKINTIYLAATVKWFSLALVTAILSLIFWRKGWWAIFTPVFLMAAAVGFAGLYNHALLKWFLYSQVIILPVIGLLFIFLPQKFTRD